MYLTREELLAYMPQRAAIELTCDEAAAMPENPDMAVIDEALASASELIDGYLRGRYALPLAQTPTVLRDLARVIARYRLYERRPEADLPEAVAETYKAAIRTLEQIRNGRITLGVRESAAAQPEPGEHRLHARGQFLDDRMARAYEASYGEYQ